MVSFFQLICILSSIHSALSIVYNDSTLTIRTLDLKYPNYSYGGASGIYNNKIYYLDAFECVTSDPLTCGTITQDKLRTLDISGATISNGNVTIPQTWQVKIVADPFADSYSQMRAGTQTSGFTSFNESLWILFPGGGQYQSNRALQFDMSIEQYEDVGSYDSQITLGLEWQEACNTHDDLYLYAVGGRYPNPDRRSNRVYRYHVANNEWDTLQNMALNRSSPSCTVVDGNLYVLGGQTGGDKSTRTTSIIGYISNSWQSVGDLLIARNQHKSFTHPNNWIITIGGRDTNSDPVGLIEIFNPLTLDNVRTEMIYQRKSFGSVINSIGSNQYVIYLWGGYINPGTGSQVYDDIQYIILSENDILFPTISPTYSPSDAPSIAPSIAPTASDPSFTPTTPPSHHPSVSPSISPTDIPTLKPTQSPLKGNDTHPPSIAPSIVPSAIPSLMPIYSPSIAPTNTITNDPTYYPSVQPSHNPSTIPTASPTIQPSTPPIHIDITDAPTLDPTADAPVDTTHESTTQPIATTSEIIVSQSPQSDNTVQISVISILVIVVVIMTIVICVFIKQKRKSNFQTSETKTKTQANTVAMVSMNSGDDALVMEYIDLQQKQSGNADNDDHDDIEAMFDPMLKQTTNKTLTTSGIQRSDSKEDNDGIEDMYKAVDATPSKQTPDRIESGKVSGQILNTLRQDPTLDANGEGEADVDNDTKAVHDWLIDCGYSQYYKLFISNGYDSLDIIKEIENRQLLKELGIEILGHQTKLWAQIKKLKNQTKHDDMGAV